MINWMQLLSSLMITANRDEPATALSVLFYVFVRVSDSNRATCVLQTEITQQHY